MELPLAKPPASAPLLESSSASGWRLVPGTVFRFVFAYWLFYSLPLVLSFPITLASAFLRLSAVPGAASQSWWGELFRYLSYPSSWLDQGMSWFTPWVCRILLGVEVQPPTQFTGSGDGLFAYCTCFAYLVLAVAVALAWTAASETWRAWTMRARPSYDRLHALMRLVVRLYLMSMMFGYGAAKIWCSQFPPITDGQLEGKFGDASPMGILWRFMQASQPYTSMTGIIEFSCGLLLICRRTTLLGALCSAGVTFQIFMLNMSYDVPVKLLSGHLLLMSLTLIAPDAPRLFTFFVLGRAIQPRPITSLFGNWKWLNRLGMALGTFLFVALGALDLYQAYQDARIRGILAPPNPNLGRWVGQEFVRDGEKVPFPPQPGNPPPQAVTPATWKGGPGMPTVIRVSVAPMAVTLMFADGSGTTYFNVSESTSELVLQAMQDRRLVAKLQVSLSEPDMMTLEGPFDGQTVRMALRKISTQKKQYVFRSREFQWIQERPFNP